MKKLIIALFLLPMFAGAQTYQAMPQAGYGPVKRMLFDSVLTLPLNILKLQNATGGRDIGQIRYNVSDSSIYIYSGSRWIKSGIDTSTIYYNLGLKLNISDTSTMLAAYTRATQTALKLNISDTSAMLLPYLRKVDTTGKFVSSISAVSPIISVGTSNPIISTSISTNKLIGRYSTGTGVMQELVVGDGLNLTETGRLNNTATPTPTGYYGAFQDNTIQTAVAINTPYAMKFGINDLSNGVTITSDGSNLTRITIANTGIYNIQFSAQFDRTNSGIDAVDIWLRKNGIDVPGSGGKIILTGGASASAIIATWNYVLDIVAGDYYQIMWSTSDTHVRILYEAAQTSPFAHPIIPSTILTVTQQSGIMAGTGITAINSITGAAQNLITGTDSSDFKIVSTGTSHKFNLPTASATKRGALSSTDWSSFNAKVNISDTAAMMAAAPRVQRFLDSIANLKTSIATKQNTLNLTTTGTNGAATLTGATLNIPQYLSANIGNSNLSLTGARTLTLNSNHLYFAGTTTTTFFANGRVTIGGISDAGYKLDVIGGDAQFNNIRVGLGAGGVATNTALGYQGLNTNTIGQYNVAVGYQTLKNATNHQYSVAVGYGALANSASNNSNTAIGYNSMGVTTATGQGNTCVGAESGKNLTNGYNAFFGMQTGINSTNTSENAAFGANAFYFNTTGARNAAFGQQALYRSTGFDNMAAGYLSLNSMTSGSRNTALGGYAGDKIGYSTSTNTASDSSIFIGYDTRPAAISQKNQVVIGYGATGLGSNTSVIGNGNTTVTGIFGNIRIVSGMATAPASATAAGTVGDIRVTSGFIYVCTATNTWVRTALTTW